MKLVRITHDRCGEADGTSILIAPDGKTEEEIEADVEKAHALYFEARDAILASLGKKPDLVVSLDAYPEHLTLGEARRLQKESQQARTEYQKKERDLTRSYDSFLQGMGYLGLWDDSPDIIECDVDWGHRHGEHMDYACVSPTDYQPDGPDGPDDADDG